MNDGLRRLATGWVIVGLVAGALAVAVPVQAAPDLTCTQSWGGCGEVPGFCLDTDCRDDGTASDDEEGTYNSASDNAWLPGIFADASAECRISWDATLGEWYHSGGAQGQANTVDTAPPIAYEWEVDARAAGPGFDVRDHDTGVSLPPYRETASVFAGEGSETRRHVSVYALGQNLDWRTGGLVIDVTAEVDHRFDPLCS